MGNDYSVELNAKNAAEVTAAYQKLNGKKLQIALIDDDEMCLRVAKHKLESVYKSGVEITAYKRYEEFEAESQKVDVVVLDYMYEQQMDNTNGLSLLVKLKMLKPSPSVYMLTGHRHMHIAVQAMKSGASDFIVKGEGCYDRLSENIYQVLKKKSVAERRNSLLSLFTKRMGF
jgi:FixJ family two-component response regulator